MTTPTASPPTRDDRVARLALSLASLPGHLPTATLVARYGAPEAFARIRQGTAPADVLTECRTDATLPALAARMLGRQALQDVRFLVPGDDQWPATLTAVPSDTGWAGDDQATAAPLGLWVTGPGDLAALAASAVAVTGSRAATSYGRHIAAELGFGLGEGRVTVATGGAYGVDAAATRAALGSCGARPLVVLAGGVDVAYPHGSADLLRDVAATGLLVSPYPPGTQPGRHTITYRAWLLAALTRAVVLVESSARGGALRTARAALGLGRPVMAVPGPVTSATSAGTNGLIGLGYAHLVTDALDVRRRLDLTAALRSTVG